MSLQQIRQNIEHLIEQLPHIADEAAHAGANVLLEEAKQNLYPGHGYLTGALQESLIAVPTDVSNNRILYGVGPDPEAPAKEAGRAMPIQYAAAIEFGSGGRPAIAYLRTALDEHKDDAAKAMAAEFARGFSHAMTK